MWANYVKIGLMWLPKDQSPCPHAHRRACNRAESYVAGGQLPFYILAWRRSALLLSHPALGSQLRPCRVWSSMEFQLKTVVFIAGKKNPATQNIFIRFSIENLIANISFYALSWPKLNFGCYLIVEIIF